MRLFSLQLKHAKKTQEQILAAERREAELQRERMDRQQQNVQEKLQQQKQLIMKQHQVRKLQEKRKYQQHKKAFQSNASRLLADSAGTPCRLRSKLNKFAHVRGVLRGSSMGVAGGVGTRIGEPVWRVTDQ